MATSVFNTPPEVWARILRGASVAFIVIDVALVCKALRKTVLSDAFWGYWSHLHRHDAARQVQLRDEMVMYAKIQSACCLKYGLQSIDNVAQLCADALRHMYEGGRFYYSEELSFRRFKILHMLHSTGQCTFDAIVSGKSRWSVLNDAFHDPSREYCVARSLLGTRDASCILSTLLDMTYCNTHLLRVFIEDFAYDSAINCTSLLNVAIERHDTQSVAYLLGRQTCDPSADDQKALVLAVTHGTSDIVNLLLQDSRVNPERALVRVKVTCDDSAQKKRNLEICRNATARPHKRLRTMWYGAT